MAGKRMGWLRDERRGALDGEEGRQRGKKGKRADGKRMVLDRFSFFFEAPRSFILNTKTTESEEAYTDARFPISPSSLASMMESPSPSREGDTFTLLRLPESPMLVSLAFFWPNLNSVYEISITDLRTPLLLLLQAGSFHLPSPSNRCRTRSLPSPRAHSFSAFLFARNF